MEAERRSSIDFQRGKVEDKNGKGAWLIYNEPVTSLERGDSL